MVPSPGLCLAETITSRRNPLVKRLRLLHDARGRRQEGLLLLEGTHLLQEVLRLQLQPRDLLATAAWLADHGAQVAALPPGCICREVSQEVLEAVATTQHPDGVVLTVAPPAPAPAAAAPAPFVLALDGLQDPGNLGTLMRTALAAGVESLWMADGADPFQPKVLRASAGAALALPLWRESRADLAGRLAAAAAAGSQVVVAVRPGAGPVAPLPYWQLDWTRPTVLLLGSEGGGVSPQLEALANQRVTIPHSAVVESLNVAVAAAPLLLERLRQRVGA
ncbi:TrmH family RNA methyltransferase [Cyanobium sp. Alchichica 3B3-8F6]|uniref:TrmH family RNA methyltransferase n=1 Tax=Cyanobium sp. Alchichica 3B3-8F6 TaxID=2823696 RepID=UPI0020CE06DB|nr:RNA methyltransferase [Cyanobium sp. Alchichica 3B3-8F6]